MKLPAIHYVARTLLQPADAITVNVIGAGGTGSHLTMALADMNCALHELDHPGLHVRLFDKMPVRTANLARQRFCPAEVGQAKATAIISRINRYYGYNWQAIPEAYNQRYCAKLHDATANITISCVDTVAARQGIAKTLKRKGYIRAEYRPLYWIDCGNSATSGQVWIATAATIEQAASTKYQPVQTLPFITDEYCNELADDPTQPSCSVREALLTQDLYINRLIALNAAGCLWKMIRQGRLTDRGVIYNAADGRMVPIPLPEPATPAPKSKRKSKPLPVAA